MWRSTPIVTSTTYAPNAPPPNNDDEQDIHGVGPSLAPCEGQCGGMYAKDGDKLRGAAYCSSTYRVVNVPGFRFLQIRVLHCGATVSKDLRHILKRFIRRLFSANPICIYGIAMDVDVLLLLANALRVASTLTNAFKEENFMSVPNLITIDCMPEIARVDFAHLDPSRRAQALAVGRLHWPVYYAREYYFWNKEPLTACITLAAAGAGHALAMLHECSPFDTHWYCDLVEELGGVVWDVRSKASNFAAVSISFVTELTTAKRAP